MSVQGEAFREAACFGAHRGSSTLQQKHAYRVAWSVAWHSSFLSDELRAGLVAFAEDCADDPSAMVDVVKKWRSSKSGDVA